MSNPTASAAAASTNRPSKRRDHEELDDCQIGQPQIKRGRFQNNDSILPASIRRLFKRRDREELEDQPGQPQRKRAALVRSPERQEVEELEGEGHLLKEEAPLEMKAPASILRPPNRPRSLPLPSPRSRVHWPESLVASTHTCPKLPKSQVRNFFWSKNEMKRMARERDQNRCDLETEDEPETPKTNSSARKRIRSEKPSATPEASAQPSKRSRANSASNQSESVESPATAAQPSERMKLDLVPGAVETDPMEEETVDSTNLDDVDVQMQPEFEMTAQPLERMEVDLIPGTMETDSIEEETEEKDFLCGTTNDANTVDETDDEPEVQMQPEPVMTAQPLEIMEVDLIPGTMETDSMEEETKEEFVLGGNKNDANTADDTIDDDDDSKPSEDQSLASLLPSLQSEAIQEGDAENETDSIDKRTSNYHTKQNNPKKRMLRELESSLDGVYWKCIIGSGRMVTRSQSRKVALD